MSASWSEITGGSAGIRQGADLTLPSRIDGTSGFESVANIDTTTGGLVEVISFAGKLNVTALAINNLPIESITIKWTVDGDVIHNDTFSNTDSNSRILGIEGDLPAIVNTLAVLEITSTTGTTVGLTFSARPRK